MKRKNTPPSLEVEILCAPHLKQENFKGKALSVSSQNKLGNFDILPYHSNFITLIQNYLVIITPLNKKIKYEFKRGVLIVYKNRVEAFLGI